MKRPVCDHMRYELKFLISEYAAELLRLRLDAALEPDPHAGPGGLYFIRSLYFDDMDRTAYRDKLSGVENRAKFRLRYYNFDDSFIAYERKEKLRDMTRKVSAPVDRELALAMTERGDILGREEPLLLDFAARWNAGLRPRVLVDYDRAVYVHPLGNTRVTLDLRVRTSAYKTDLFDADMPSLPVLEPGTAVLELKYDRVLPAFLPRLLEGVPKQRTSVSKYCRCLSIGE